MYLLLLRCLTRDLPIKLCTTWEEAFDISNRLTPNHVPRIAREFSCFSFDVSEAKETMVVSFDENGEPVGFIDTKSFPWPIEPRTNDHVR